MTTIAPPKPTSTTAVQPIIDPVERFITWVREGIRDKTIGSDYVGCVSRTSIVCLTMLPKIWDLYKATNDDVQGNFRGIHSILLLRMNSEELQHSQYGEPRHRFTTREQWEQHVKNREAGDMDSSLYPPDAPNKACKMYALRVFDLTLEDMTLFRKIPQRAAVSREFVPHELLPFIDDSTVHQIGISLHESQIADLETRYPTMKVANTIRHILERVLPMIAPEDYKNDEISRDSVIGTGKYVRISNVILGTKINNLLRSVANANEVDIATTIKTIVFTDIYTKGVDLTFL